MKFSTWLEATHPDFNEAWYDPRDWASGAKKVAMTGALLGGMAMGGANTAQAADNPNDTEPYTTLSKTDTTRFHPYSWKSGKPGGSGIETPDWTAAMKNYKKFGKTFLKPQHDKVFMQQLHGS